MDWDKIVASESFTKATILYDDLYLEFSKEPTNLPLVDFRIAFEDEKTCIDAHLFPSYLNVGD